jgi:hypothetical protein
MPDSKTKKYMCFKNVSMTVLGSRIEKCISFKILVFLKDSFYILELKNVCISKILVF